MRPLRTSLICSLLAVGACKPSDVTAPPAPWLDPVQSPTSLPTQSITGSAEYGATVSITGGLEDVQVTADDFTALFRAEIALVTEVAAGEDGVTTTLTLVATDAEGNASEATTVEILYEPPHPESLILALSKDLITADEGEIIATARTTNDELLDLSGFEVTFTLTGVPGVVSPNDTIVATTNSSGVARATFSNLRSVTDTANVLATSFSLSDDRDFEIVAGRAAAFTHFGFDTDADGVADATDATIQAGDDLTYVYATEDEFGNPASGQVLVSVNSPDAVIFDDGLSGSGLVLGLSRAGSYTMTGRIAGAGTVSPLTVDVTIADGPRYVDLALTLTRMAINDTVIALTLVRDGYGNIISTPLPTYAVTPQNPATIDFLAPGWTSANPNITITKPGVYVITASFDDGTNPPASDEEYLLVEAIPDLTPPLVRVLRVDGFEVCGAATASPGVLELNQGDCLDADPAVVFRPRQFVTVEIEVDDDRGLAEVSYKAFGLGVSAQDFTLVGSGQHTPGTPLVVSFIFRINNTVVPGDASIVAQAKDQAGNSANSSAALMRIDLGITASGGRTVETIVGGGVSPNAQGVAYDESTGQIAVANRSNNDRTVLGVSGAAVTTLGVFPERPEDVVYDSSGNLFVTLDNLDEVWMIDGTDRSQVVYITATSDPEGLALISTGRAATGRFIFAGGVGDAESVTITNGGTDHVFEFDTAADGCAGGGEVCVVTTAGQAAAMTALAAAIGGDAGTAAIVGAFEPGTNCEASGNPCVYLVAQTPGAGITYTASDTSGNITSSAVANGEDAELLYVADRGNNRVYEFGVPNNPGAAALNTFNPNMQPRDVDAALVGGPPARLIMYATDSGNDRVRHYDSGPAVWRDINITGGPGYNGPWGIVIADNGCILVANDGNGRVIAVDPATGASELIIDGMDQPRGLALEGSGPNANLLVADEGFGLVIRISATPSTTDCF